MGISNNLSDTIKSSEEKLLISIESFINMFNKKGNEKRIIRFGQSLAEKDLFIQEAYIIMLCKSDYPIVAAMTANSMYHEDSIRLKEIVLAYMEGSNWSVYDKIITNLYIGDDEKTLKLLDCCEDSKLILDGFTNAKEYLIAQSEYKLLFDLIYAVVRSKHSQTLSLCLYKLNINEFYIKQQDDIIRNSCQILYDKKDFASLFMLCKNLKILHCLKNLLLRQAEELEKEFITAGTIAGIRLAFRILQNELQNDEKAYIAIIRKISKMEPSEEVKYIYFCYILKLIKLQGRLSEEIKDMLIHIGEVKLAKEKIYCVNLLADCLECTMLNQGMEAYNEFVTCLGINNLFRNEKQSPKVLPYFIYINEGFEKIERRKEFFSNLKNQENWQDKALLGLYMNSFYKYFISIHEFFQAIYLDREDRVYIRNTFKESIFYGRVNSINFEKESATATFQNAAYKHAIILTNKIVGENHIKLLKVGDEFSFKLNKFNPGSGYISITNFKLLDNERQEEFINADLSFWMDLKNCFQYILKIQKFTDIEKQQVEAIPHIDFKKLNLVDEFTMIYSEVLYRLRKVPYQIIEFIKALEVHKNNYFSIDKREALIAFGRSEELSTKSIETIKSVLALQMNRNDLIWLYVNSYLRLTVNIQFLLEALIKPEEQALNLDYCFYEYRFYGQLADYIHVDSKGIKSINVRTKSLLSLGVMSFILGKEPGVTEKMIQERTMVSFRLRKYFKGINRVAIEDVRSADPKNQVKLQNWNTIHNCNKLIRHQGKVFKETLRELNNLPKLNLIKVEGEHFYSDFFWCINNLSKREEDLYLYIKALGDNNPYFYQPGEYNKVFWKVEDEFTNEEAWLVLMQLIENNYSLYKILWIYLNSNLCRRIAIHNVFQEYYKKCIQLKGDSLHYMPGKVTKISFLATIASIKDSEIILKLNEIYCNGNVFLQIDDSYDIEEEFKLNHQITVNLAVYDQNMNYIYAEIQ